MKFLIFYIILLFTTIIIQQCISKELFERLYVNMIPHQVEDCSDQVTGIGYSGVVDTCLSIDNHSNFKFQISQKHNTITWSTYKARNGGSTTCNTNILSNNTRAPGSCISSTLFNIDQDHSAMNKFYYEITISTTPFIPSNSWTDINMASTDWNGCEPDNIVQALYLTNGTVSQFSTSVDRYVYLCINGDPMVKHCKTTKINPNYCYSPQNTSLSCYREISFYNGSSFEVPSGSGTSGFYTGVRPTSSNNSGNSGTGGNSDLSSGSASASSTSSSSSGVSNTNDNNNINEDMSGNGYQSSSSEELINYFRSTQCSQ